MSRNGPGGAYETLALGQPNTGAWSWLVTGPATAKAYLRVAGHDGEGHAFADTSTAAFGILPGYVGVDPPGAGFTITRVAPNPTAGGTDIVYTLAQAASVRLAVFDLNGRRLAKLAQGFRAPGMYDAEWNGRTRDGRAPAGVYLVRYEVAGKSCVRRIAVVP